MTVFLIVLAILVLFLVLFTEELYRYVFCRKSSAIFCKLFDSKGHEEHYYEVRDAAAERLKNAECQKYSITNDRGQKLCGFYYPCGSEGKKIAFLLHGYRSNHLEGTGMYYDYYKSHGIDFFCCDHTASGDSEGTFIGFDVFESQDCLKWLDFLKDKFGENTQIILHGFSMGAATVLQMSGHCPSNVKFIISDSAYENAHASMDHQIGPFYYPLRLINKLIGGYDWNASDVKDSLSKSSIPILFVHGKNDKLVPYQNGPRLYEMYQGPKDGLFSENTKHIETMYTSPAEYTQKIDRFMEMYLEK